MKEYRMPIGINSRVRVHENYFILKAAAMAHTSPIWGRRGGLSSDINAFKNQVTQIVQILGMIVLAVLEITGGTRCLQYFACEKPLCC